MKNEVNRALWAKKKQYIQPHMQATDIQCVTVIAASGGMGLFGTATSDQW